MATSTTPNLKPRYPDGTEIPNVPLWLSYLAADVDTAVDTRPFARASLDVTLSIAANSFTAIGRNSSGFLKEARGITFNTTTGLFTVPRAGLYQINYGVYYEAAGGTYRQAFITDGAIGLAGSRLAATALGANVAVNGSRLMRLGATAGVGLAGAHDAAAFTNALAQDSYFSIAWVGV